MLNIKSTNSPISIIHEDTKLILEALKNIDPILENKPVRLPLLVTDRMIPIKDRNKDTATFVGLMLLDFDNNFYFVEDATYFSDRIKVAVPILVNHHLVLNKNEETILKLLEENLKFFSSLSEFHLSYLISGFANAGLKSKSFIKSYLERINRSYLLETLQNDLKLPVDVLSDRFEMETQFAKRFFTNDELMGSFLKKINECSFLEAESFGPSELSLPFYKNYELLTFMFESMSYDYQIKTLKNLESQVYRFRSPQGLALLVCELWDSVFKTNKKLVEETELIILASEMVSALIASDLNDHQSILTFKGQKIEKLFSYVFFNPYNDEYKQTFLEQLEKWFAYKERVVTIKNDIIITLILREDLELNFDKKLIDLLNKNPMNVLDNAQVEHADITRDVIWNSVLFNLDNIGFIDLMQPIVNACDCKFLY